MDTCLLRALEMCRAHSPCPSRPCSVTEKNLSPGPILRQVAGNLPWLVPGSLPCPGDAPTRSSHICGSAASRAVSMGVWVVPPAAPGLAPSCHVRASEAPRLGFHVKKVLPKATFTVLKKKSLSTLFKVQKAGLFSLSSPFQLVGHCSFYGSNRLCHLGAVGFFFRSQPDRPVLTQHVSRASRSAGFRRGVRLCRYSPPHPPCAL